MTSVQPSADVRFRATIPIAGGSSPASSDELRRRRIVDALRALRDGRE